MIHHIPVKTALFLVTGLVETMTGTAALHSLGGLLRRSPFTAIVFLIAAMSLAGIPPLSGFFGKLLLLQAGFDAGAWTVTAISLAVGLFTLFSMTKIWAAVFWGEPETPLPAEAVQRPERPRPPVLMNLSTAGLTAITLAVGLWAQPLWHLCQQAAHELLTPQTTYIAAVLGR